MPSGEVVTLNVSNRCLRCGARGAGICDAMPDQALQRLSAAAVPMEITAGRRFIDEGEAAEHFFTVTAGTARLMKTLPDGRQQIISFAGRGDFLGLAVSETYSHTIEAVDHVTLCRFSRSALRGLMADYPAVEKRLLEYATHELVLAQEQMLLLGRKTARERLATFLLWRARLEQGCADGRVVGPVTLMLPMSRVDIADYVGLTMETVSRALAGLQRENAIRINRISTVEVADLGVLARIAEGE
jgi:CRP/FNR family transcriptional regulator, anaerobic regulatory protein